MQLDKTETQKKKQQEGKTNEWERQRDMTGPGRKQTESWWENKKGR